MNGFVEILLFNITVGESPVSGYAQSVWETSQSEENLRHQQ